jgi:anti-sigma factor ChrR (cupin superfamily)
MAMTGFDNEHSSSDGTRRVSSRELSWRKSNAPGFLYKTLHEDARRGQRTWLMRVEPGAFAPAHAHDEQEEVYVLSGSFYDDNGTYRPGDYILRPAGAVHSAGSEEGCEMLLVYRATAAPAS